MLTPDNDYQLQASTTVTGWSQADPFNNLGVGAALVSPRLIEFGSPTRCGGSGLQSVAGIKPDYDAARFFSARDILDLINQLHKSAKIAMDEASGLHGHEQVNRVKAKCSKVCGLANRLIDLYVATIKAKVARILRKLGLGLAQGQDLLYYHLTVLQDLVDQAFVSFNAMQYAEAARIRQAKRGNGLRRENSAANLTWRSPAAERKPPFRPGSHGSMPQPAQYLDIKDLLLGARAKFMEMAEELVDLKDELMILDRARIHAAIVAVEAEGEVPDPLPQLKSATDGISYGFNTRCIYNGGAVSLTAAAPLAAAAPKGTVQRPGARDASGAVTSSPRALQSPRGSSRLMRCSLDASASPVPTKSPAKTPGGGSQLKACTPESGSSMRGVSEPGAGMEEVHAPWMPVAFKASGSGTLKLRLVISDAGHQGLGDGEPASGGDAAASGSKGLFEPSTSFGPWLGAPSDAGQPPVASAVGPASAGSVAPDLPGRHLTKQRSGARGGPPASPKAPHGQDHATGLVRSLRDQFASVAGAPEAPRPVLHVGRPATFAGAPPSHEATGPNLWPEEAVQLRMELQARTATAQILSSQAAKHLYQLKVDTEVLRELVLDAVRLVERDPLGLNAALESLNLTRREMEEATERCRSGEAGINELQTVLRTCLDLLKHQLRRQASHSATSASGNGSNSAPPTTRSFSEGSASAQHPVCTRCSELAAFVQELLPLINAVSSKDRRITTDRTPSPEVQGTPPELAPDGSQDEVMLLPLADDLDADDGTAEGKAEDAMVVVLQRLTTLLERLRQLEDDHLALELALEQERRERQEVERKAAELKEDRDKADMELVSTQQRLVALEMQLDHLREKLQGATLDLESKAAQIATMHGQLLSNDSAKHGKMGSLIGFGLYGTNLLGVDEKDMELEGIRLERENLKAMAEMQGSELRQLQVEVTGLRAAKEKLVAELQEMQTLLHAQEAAAAAASVEDLPLMVARTRSSGLSISALPSTGINSKAAARGLTRGVPTAAGGGVFQAGKGRAGPVSASVDGPLSSVPLGSDNMRGPGADADQLASLAMARSGLPNELCSSSSSMCVSTLASALASPGGGAAKRSLRRGIPMPPGMSLGMPAGRSASSSVSLSSTPRENNYGALARLEEVQVQLEREVNERQTLESRLEAAQSLLLSKDKELATTKLLLIQFERVNRATPLRQQSSKKNASTGGMPPRGTAAAADDEPYPAQRSLLDAFDCDALTVLGATPRQPFGGRTFSGEASTSAISPCVSEGRANLVAQLERLQAECDELSRRAADLEEQRALAEQTAEDRALELEATSEYIQELEEEASLLREVAESATLQMKEKEKELMDQVEALTQAREELARAQGECQVQAENVQEHGTQLDLAQEQLEAAQARAAELKKRGEEQTEAGADALVELREEIEQMQSDLADSQAALAAAQDDLAAAREAVAAADEALTEQQRTSEGLHAQVASELQARNELLARVAAAEEIKSSLKAQLNTYKDSHDKIEAQLEDAATAQLEVAAKLASLEVAYAEALGQLEQSEAAQQQLRDRLEIGGGQRSDLEQALATLSAERVELSKRLAARQAEVEQQASKLAEAEEARLTLATDLKASEVRIRSLDAKLHDAEASRLQLHLQLTDAVAALHQAGAKAAELHASYSVLAAQLATTRAARDEAYGRAVTVDAAQQQLHSQLEQAEVETRVQQERVVALQQHLCRAQELEALLPQQMAADAASRAAEAAELVQAHKQALADVQARYKAALAEAKLQASKVATLEENLAHSTEEKERAVLQAATAAAHSEMLCKQLQQLKAENASLEEQLATARAEHTEQARVSAMKAVEMEERLAASHAMTAQQAEHFAEGSAAMRAELASAITSNNELAARAASQVAELRAQLAFMREQNAKEMERFTIQAADVQAELDAARAALQAQGERSAAHVKADEEQLAASRVTMEEQATYYVAQIADLEARVSEAHVKQQQHAESSAAYVAEVEAKLEAVQAQSVQNVEQSTAQVQQLTDQLAAARTEMAGNLQVAANQAADLEAHLEAASAAMAEHVQRSAAEVQDLVAQLEAARRKGAESADRAEQEVTELEARLTDARAEQAALADRSVAQVADLEARLAAAQTENEEQAKRAAEHAGKLQQQLASAEAMSAEHAHRARLQAEELTAQLLVARVELSNQATRSSAEMAGLLQQLEATWAALGDQAKQYAAQAAALESELACARAECLVQAERMGTASAELEAQLQAARAEIATQVEKSSAHVAALEAELVSAQAAFAAKSEVLAVKVAELQTELAAAREQVDSAGVHAFRLEEDLLAAHTTNADQAQQAAVRVAGLEEKIEALTAAKVTQAEAFASQASQLAAQLAAARAEGEEHVGMAAVAVLQEQLDASRQQSALQKDRIAALEEQLQNTLVLLGIAHAVEQQQAEELLQLRTRILEMVAQVAARDMDLQELKGQLLALQVTVQEREATLADRTDELERLRQKLMAALAILEQSQAAVERLKHDVAVATAAAETAATHQQANLATAITEQAHLHDLLSELTFVSSSHLAVVSGLRNEVESLRVAQQDASSSSSKAAVSETQSGGSTRPQQQPGEPVRTEAKVGVDVGVLAVAQSSDAGVSAGDCFSLAAFVTAPTAEVRAQPASGPRQELTQEIAGIQRVLEAQQGAAAGMLESLKTRLVVADQELCQAKARVAELQNQLGQAEGRVEAAQQAAESADSERHRVEALLAAAVADSAEGRLMVQQLSAELARYTNEIELVRASLITKQALLDQLEAVQAASEARNTLAHGPTSGRSGEEGDDAADLDRLAEEFLDGCMWGMGIGALQHPASGALRSSGAGPSAGASPARSGQQSSLTPNRSSGGSHRCEPLDSASRARQARSSQEDLADRALRFRGLGGNLLELLEDRWQGNAATAMRLRDGADAGTGAEDLPSQSPGAGPAPA